MSSMLSVVEEGSHVSHYFLLFLSLLLVSPSRLASQAEKSSAASAAKQSSAQTATPNCSSEDPKAAATGSNIKSSFSGVESGCVTGNVYRNDFLGFSYEFPKDWITEKPETLHKLNDKWESEAKGGRLAFGLYWTLISPNAFSPRIVLYASSSGKRDGSQVAIPSIRIGAQQTDERFLDVEKLRHKFERMDAKKSARLLRPADGFVLKRHSFFRLEFEGRQGATPIWVSRLQTFLNGHMVLFEFYASSEEELQQLSSTIESISFIEDKP